jgi:hypothetical protein
MATQLKVLAACLLPLTTLNVNAQPEDKPRLVPLFSTVRHGPAFMLECRNESPAAVGILELIQGLIFRVDGVELRETGGIARPLMGGEPFLEPMQTWRNIKVGLGQDNPRLLGAVLGSPWVPLAPGHHTLAIRCLGNWSDEVEFYWESA